MFSPLDDSALTDWFRRFDAAAKHLPAEDRAAQHEELRQHLDALAAANVASGQSPETAQQNALIRLGNPSQIGRKLDHAWQQSRAGFRADMKAIGFGLSLYAAVLIAINFTNPLWPSNVYPSLMMLLFLGVTILRSAAIGLSYPQQAIRAALYSYLLGNTFFWLSLVRYVRFDSVPHFENDSLHLWVALVHTPFKLLLWIIGSVIVAYLASVTRRGWYLPSLADFALSLPKKKVRA